MSNRDSLSTDPIGWYYVAALRDLKRGPLSFEIGQREYVAFLDEKGQPALLDGRCPHMGAKLARGRACDGRIHCPLHGWTFDSTGSCTEIPAGDCAPDSARTGCYPTCVLGEHVFAFNAPRAAYPMPFFAGVSPSSLIAAPAFAFDVEMPWYLVSSNGFDAQHLRVAHDRQIQAPPVIRECSEYAFEVEFQVSVTGAGWRDRMTRKVSGGAATMTVRSLGGTIVLVTSRFSRTITYGLVSILPLAPTQSQVRIVIWKKKAGAFAFLDSIDVRVRARFIRAFLQPDIDGGQGISYDPCRMVPSDQLLSDYLTWLARSQETLRTIAAG